MTADEIQRWTELLVALGGVITAITQMVGKMRAKAQLSTVVEAIETSHAAAKVAAVDATTEEDQLKAVQQIEALQAAKQEIKALATDRGQETALKAVVLQVKAKVEAKAAEQPPLSAA